jgi:hypothetical protein
LASDLNSRFAPVSPEEKREIIKGDAKLHPSPQSGEGAPTGRMRFLDTGGRFPKFSFKMRQLRCHRNHLSLSGWWLEVSKVRNHRKGQFESESSPECVSIQIRICMSSQSQGYATLSLHLQNLLLDLGSNCSSKRPRYP